MDFNWVGVYFMVVLIGPMELFLVVFCLIRSSLSQGYHSEIGIPAALRIYKAETTASPYHKNVKSKANLAAHPYLVGTVVGMGESFSVCGSSLLSRTRALTAAHCWWDGWTQAEEFTLVFGSEYIFVGGVRRHTVTVTMYPRWDPNTLMNDLAMVVFEKVHFSDYIQPIAVPTNLQKVNFVGYAAQTSGYGQVKLGTLGAQKDQMQTIIDMEVVPTQKCVKIDQIILRSLCARETRPSNNCISHSGGPLVTVHKNQRYLIGVSSFGDYNCTSGLPSGFVRLTFYLKWIFKNMGEMEH